MANITNASQYGGQSIVVSPMGEIMAQVESRLTEGFASAIVPIRVFRENRKIPQLTTEFNQDLFDQYVPELPLNHLDLIGDKVPENGKEMTSLFD